jgi:hypothetical protein
MRHRGKIIEIRARYASDIASRRKKVAVGR